MKTASSRTVQLAYAAGCILTAATIGQARVSDPAFEFQHPFIQPNHTTSQSASILSSSANEPLRVAIVGGGPSGTSSAFFLSRLASLSHKPIELTIYERSDYIGGRSRIIYPFDDSHRYEPIEAGASMFVPVNKILFKATDEFGLQRLPFGGEHDGGELGIWDGTEMVFQTSSGTLGDWWDTVKLFWRYGRSPMTLRSLTKTFTDQFMQLYSDQWVNSGAVESIASIFAPLGASFAHLLQLPASKYLITENNINKLCVGELVEIATRVNYGTGVGTIHALGGLVSLAAEGGVGVKGGNRQIFQQFAERSGAKVELETQVTRVYEQPSSRKGRKIEYVLSSLATTTSMGGEHFSTTSNKTFDVLLLAAPQHPSSASPIDLPASLTAIPMHEYVHLYVTFLCTNASSPLGSYFGLEKDVPRTIYSSFVKSDEGTGEPPLFNSLSYLRNLGPREGVIGDVHIVKLFSARPLTAEALSPVFPVSDQLHLKAVKWYSYPVLSPVPLDDPSFPPMKLGSSAWYGSAMERALSTMETQSFGGFSIARGIAAEEGWKGWENWKFTE